MRPSHDSPNSPRDVLSDQATGHQPHAGALASAAGSPGDDVRAQWAASAAQAASRAYTAAYGREITDDATRMRWHLEPRVAVTAVVVLVLLGLGAWWATSSGPSLPAHIETSAAPTSKLTQSASDRQDGTEASKPSEALTALVLHVTGAVAQPGLVTLEPGARVADAVEQAGGVVSEADLAAVNLARVARDGEHIHVPLVGEAPAPGAASGPVDLNTADASQLEDLPGIGPVLATRIIADREANGPFASLEDLARVSGVGDAMVQGLADLAHA